MGFEVVVESQAMVVVVVEVEEVSSLIVVVVDVEVIRVVVDGVCFIVVVVVESALIVFIVGWGFILVVVVVSTSLSVVDVACAFVFSKTSAGLAACWFSKTLSPASSFVCGVSESSLAAAIFNARLTATTTSNAVVIRPYPACLKKSPPINHHPPVSRIRLYGGRE